MKRLIPATTLIRRSLALLAAALLGLAFQTTARADVTVVSSGTNSIASGTSVTITGITAPNGGLVVVGASLNTGNGGAAMHISSVTWNGTALTCAGARDGSAGTCGTDSANNVGTIRMEIWTLKLNATQGATGNVVVTASGTSSLVAGAVALAGVSASPVGTFASNGSSVAAGSGSVTTISNPGPGGIVFDTLAVTSGKTVTPAAGQTQQWNTGVTNIVGAGSLKNTTGSGGTLTNSWTISPNSTWALGAIPITAAAPVRRTQTIIGSKNSAPVPHISIGSLAAVLPVY
jgi:fibronectin-binding autotransporter adhesin